MNKAISTFKGRVRQRIAPLCRYTPVSEASESLGTVIVSLRKTRRSKLLVVFTLAVMTLTILIPSYGQGTKVFNCPSGFSSTGICEATSAWEPGCGGPFCVVGTPTNGGPYPALSGTQMNLMPVGSSHTGLNFNYQAGAVSAQAFSSTFTFIPNGWNLSFVLNNNTVPDQGSSPASFASGAGCEASFYQAFGTYPTAWSPNNIFALELDQWSPLTDANGTSATFSYSSAQIYQTWQSPCNPAYTPGEIGYYATQKVSTSPVPLNSPANTTLTTTGHTYSATLVYTGTDLTLNLYDMTAGGSCPGASCFSYTWQDLSIPTWVNGTTAYVGLASGNSGAPATSSPLYINSWTYTNLSAAATPTFSLAGGTYSGTQSVTISDSSSGAIICYNTTGAPATNGIGGCEGGTLYTGAISVTSGETIYAVAGSGTSSYGDSAVASSAYQIGTTASQPTFFPAQGVYDGNQTVTLTAAQGAVICYSTTGSPAPNGSTGCTTGTLYSGPITISANETLYAASGGTGFTNSSVGSATYTISPFWGGPTVDTTSPLPANSPTFLPLPGSYSATQNVTISSTTPGLISAIFCRQRRQTFFLTRTAWVDA